MDAPADRSHGLENLSTDVLSPCLLLSVLIDPYYVVSVMYL